MEQENTPIIISNDLDQAPKTGEHYQKVLDVLMPQIIEAMDRFISFDEEYSDKKLIDWVEKNCQNLPLNQINQLLSNHKFNKISVQLKKEKKQYKGGWESMSGTPSFLNFGELGYVCTQEGQPLSIGGKILPIGGKELPKRGEIGTYLTFEYNDSGAYKVSVNQLENATIEGTVKASSYVAMLNEGIGSYKELSFNEFMDAMENK